MQKKLGVNVDHVATLRQARGVEYPDPVEAALLVEKGGGDQITVHLREDRRHIQDGDLARLKKSIKTELNLEMAATKEMFSIAANLRPDSSTLVPEKREELTTEGGLDLARNFKKIESGVAKLRKAGVRTSAFINPDERQVRLARELGFDAVELHTGAYCEVSGEKQKRELGRIIRAAALADEIGLYVAAGHGLNLENTAPVARIKEIVEFNIGHSIVARAVFVGIEQAVREMKELLKLVS